MFIMALALLHVDTAHSSAGFTIKHFLVGSTHGTMKVASVDMALQANSAVPASIDAVVDVGSVNTSDAGRDDDLRSEEWFDVAHYPTLHFTSTRVESGSKPNAFRVDGNLSLHGISKPVPLDCTVSDTMDHGVHHYHYVATTTFDRRDFKVDAPNKTLHGPLFIGTSVTVRIDLDMVEAG
jgi:polyisoprenoid-binding protein YceI